MGRFSEKVYKAARNAEVVGVPHSEAEYCGHVAPVLEARARAQVCEGQFLRLLLSLGTGSIVAQLLFPSATESLLSGVLATAGLLCNLMGITGAAIALYAEVYDKKFEYDVRRVRLKEWRDQAAGISWMPPAIFRHSGRAAYGAFLLEAVCVTLAVVLR